MYDEITIGNPHFIQTIELLRYLDKLRSWRTDEDAQKRLRSGTLKVAKVPRLKLSCNKLSNHNKYTQDSIDEVCRKTMILILTHAGYHKVDPDCLNLLIDLFKSHMRNLTSMFRKKLDQESIVNSNNSQSASSNDHELLLLGKVFNELGLSFGTFQQFNYGLVLYRDHVLNQIDDLKAELNLPIEDN